MRAESKDFRKGSIIGTVTGQVVPDNLESSNQEKRSQLIMIPLNTTGRWNAIAKALSAEKISLAIRILARN